jgi:hypothetical protein
MQVIFKASNKKCKSSSRNRTKNASHLQSIEQKNASHLQGIEQKSASHLQSIEQKKCKSSLRNRTKNASHLQDIEERFETSFDFDRSDYALAAVDIASVSGTEDPVRIPPGWSF